MRTIELLSPAKDLAAAVAAVDYGADAIYMGGSRFGARRAAANSVDDIARAAEYAHRYGVRVHAALNTVLFDDELEAAEAQARELIAAGVDALIVQDMALRRMDLPAELHASTQTGNTSPEGVRFLQDCGFARVIRSPSTTYDAYAPPPPWSWSVSCTGRYAWGTADAAFYRAPRRREAATAASARSRAACRTTSKTPRAAPS